MLFPPVQAAAPSAQAAISAALDDFHLAAAQADEARYFAHFDETAIFLGTDASERWTKAQFQAYAHPYFEKGKAWSFRATRRAITVSLGPILGLTAPVFAPIESVLERLREADGLAFDYDGD